MSSLLKIAGWVLCAPVAWILGSLLICSTPVAYVLERNPLDNVPPHQLTEAHVARLNAALEQVVRDSQWSPSPLIVILQPTESMIAAPSATGKLELVHVYPSLAMRVSGEGPDWDSIIQAWLNEKNGRKEEIMTLLKRIYLFLSGAWLLFCMLRLIIPYLGNYYKLDRIGCNHFTLTTFDNFAGKCKDDESTYILPLTRYAELNARLAKAQPESQFFFAPMCIRLS